MLRNTVRSGGGVSFPGKKRYKGVRFNVISVTRVWVGVKWVSDFLENSVTNVTLLRVTTGGWVSSFQKQLLYNT